MTWFVLACCSDQPLLVLRRCLAVVLWGHIIFVSSCRAPQCPGPHIYINCIHGCSLHSHFSCTRSPTRLHVHVLVSLVIYLVIFVVYRFSQLFGFLVVGSHPEPLHFIDYGLDFDGIWTLVKILSRFTSTGYQPQIPHQRVYD